MYVEVFGICAILRSMSGCTQQTDCLRFTSCDCVALQPMPPMHCNNAYGFLLARQTDRCAGVPHRVLLWWWGCRPTCLRLGYWTNQQGLIGFKVNCVLIKAAREANVCNKQSA
jgi:hypothetical protein